MQKTIYLYMGLPKTGTTSIQDFLFDNRIELEKMGLLYPTIANSSIGKIKFQTKVNLRGFFKKDFNFFDSYEACFLKEMPDTKSTYIERFKNCFLDQIIESKAKKVILSEERMSTLIMTTPTFIEVLKSFGFYVKIIVYIRPAAEWIASLWNDHVRHSITRTSLNYYFENTYDFIDLTKIFTYIQIFGKENVIIRPYEKLQWKNSNLLDDFLNIFSFNTTIKWKQKSEKQNISLERNILEIIRILTYSGTLKYMDKSLIRKKLSETDGKEMKTIKTLTDYQILDITNRTRHLYTRLAKIYGKESFFINEFPSCYGKERSVFDTVTINEEQQEIVLEALNKNRLEQDNLIKGLQEENAKLQAQLKNKKT